MRKHLILGVAIAAVALMFTACGGSSRMTKATSTRVDLAKSVRCIPTLATLDVRATRVTATAYANELESLNAEEQKQAVVAKALATVNGDVMLAPQFSTAKGPDGKMTSITVTGYSASIKSFRPMTEADFEFNPDAELLQARTPDRVALNTLTVAEMEYSAKKSVALTPVELVGKNEESALKLAKEKMLRQEKMDVLFGEQYTVTINNGAVSAFTLTAFPGKYATYRKTNKREMLAVKPSAKPAVFYQTIAADIQTVAPRAQLKFGTGNTQATESELKETARAAALKKFNADFMLNETFYFDYQDKVITHVTICGTPAVYANFRPLQKDELVDAKLVPFSGEGAAGVGEAPAGLFDSLKNLFKKK